MLCGYKESFTRLISFISSIFLLSMMKLYIVSKIYEFCYSFTVEIPWSLTEYGRSLTGSCLKYHWEMWKWDLRLWRCLCILSRSVLQTCGSVISCCETIIVICVHGNCRSMIRITRSSIESCGDLIRSGIKTSKDICGTAIK